jgi:hypothetical protein
VHAKVISMTTTKVYIYEDSARQLDNSLHSRNETKQSHDRFVCLFRHSYHYFSSLLLFQHIFVDIAVAVSKDMFAGPPDIARQNTI